MNATECADLEARFKEAARAAYQASIDLIARPTAKKHAAQEAAEAAYADVREEWLQRHSADARLPDEADY